MYSHPVYFWKPSSIPERFRGTCYRAANWQLLGQTTGAAKSNSYNRTAPIKEVLGYPLTPRFRELSQPVMKMKTAADRCEPGRTGPDHRAQRARR
jgi:hypothetical protein